MKFRSILYGVGKAGNIVGRKGKGGEYIISAYQPKVHNPQTLAQMTQRYKAKAAVQSLSPFAQWAKLMIQPSGKRTYWSELIKLNLDEAIVGSYPDFELDFSKTILANGTTLDLPYSPSATADGTTLSLTWADNSGMGNANADDKLAFIAYNESKRQAVFNTGLAERADRNATATLPSAWTGDNVNVWIAMRSLDGKLSRSTHLATLPL